MSMYRRQLITTAAMFLMCCSLSVGQAQANTINAASCSRADVLSAYNAALTGDTINIPSADCTSSNKWSSYLTIQKSVTIQGQGAASTKIGISAGNSGFQVQANNVRITGLTLDCGYLNTTNGGIIRVGSAGTNPTYNYKDFRIDHNTITRCGDTTPGSTGREALSLFGYIYGVIDHNTFNDCNAECLNICADGALHLERDHSFGQYTNGTIFIEDNVFNANNTASGYENIIDGNSQQRFTFRHNTVNISNGASYASGIVSTHETCATCSGDHIVGGDAGSAAYEMYDNTINLNSTGTMRDLGIIRAGRTLIYNNHIVGTNLSGSRYDVTSWISDYRSVAAYGGIPSACSSAAHPRGYSGACHEVDGSYTSEGLDQNKTTLNGGVTASQTTIPLTSIAGFDANGLADGFSILVGSEQIDYTGISGNQLTGAIRGANHTTAASHSSGASVGYLRFGNCLEQPNNVSIWNNDINGSISSSMNDVSLCGYYPNGSCVGDAGPDYTAYDIQSFTQRPNNYQYRLATAYSYTPYPYPHPLTGATAPQTPTNLRIIGAALPLPLFILVSRYVRRKTRKA